MRPYWLELPQYTHGERSAGYFCLCNLACVRLFECPDVILIAGARGKVRVPAISYFLNRLSNAARASVAFRGPASMLGVD